MYFCAYLTAYFVPKIQNFQLVINKKLKKIN